MTAATSASLKISNRDARRLILDVCGLSARPVGALRSDGLLAMIEHLGFVQLDSIQTVARAHHHILWSRNQNYRPALLDKVLTAERRLFEHWTHDAAVLPIAFYPHWRHRFGMFRQRIEGRAWWRERLGDRKAVAEVRKRIEAEGPLRVRDFQGHSQRSGSWWGWSPHKSALEFLWFTGELATHGRDGFQKIYDLAERVIPDPHFTDTIDFETHVDWMCRNALQRLGFGADGDIQRFWDGPDLATVKAWTGSRKDAALISVEAVSADGKPVAGYALPDIEERMEALAEPTSRLRLLSPFDPLVRDRTRLQRLFGFDYRIEIFVPATKRQYGYYVFPMLEGDRFVGRADVSADSKSACLIVKNIWFEPGIKVGKDRRHKLVCELERMARFAACNDIVWECKL